MAKKKSKSKSVSSKNKDMSSLIKEYVVSNRSSIITAEELIKIGFSKSDIKPQDIPIKAITLKYQSNGTYFIHY